MPSSFKVTLDTTTQLGVEINGGNSTTKNTTVTLELALDPDAVLVKVWGSINPLDPANAGFGETEEGAEWLPAESVFLVNTTTNGGQKTLHVRVQDDVGNEATDSASINLQVEGEIPPAPPSQAPLPAGGAPEPKPAPEHRRIVSGSYAGRIRDHASSVRSRRRQRGIGAGRIHSSHTIGSRAASEPSQITTRVQSSIRARRAAGTSVSRVRGGATSVRRRDGDDFLATIEELGIL